MTVSTWLNYAIDRLVNAGIGTARLDSQLLLSDALGQDRSWLSAHLDTPIAEDVFNQLDQQLVQRCKHVPLAYIRGKTEFYGREFLVDKRVLEPRPESETMIEVFKKLPVVKRQEAIQLIDVGTGSGALAVTAKLEFPKAEVVAIDINPDCLEIAQANARKHEVTINFAQGDMLEPIQSLEHPAIITLANLPYVPDDHHVNQAALQEPHDAIFGGQDGLNLYRKLFKQAADLPTLPAYILTESLPPQHHQLKFIAARYGFRISLDEDFIQLFEGGYHKGVEYQQ